MMLLLMLLLIAIMMIRAGMVTLYIVLPHVDIGKDNNHIECTIEVLVSFVLRRAGSFMFIAIVGTDSFTKVSRPPLIVRFWAGSSLK